MRVSVLRLQLARQLVPAYVVHPRVETVEADVQGYHWTGCRLAEGAPRVVREREGTVDVSLFRGEVEKSIIISREFETPNQEHGRPPNAYSLSLVRRLLMSVFSRTPSYPQLRDLHLAHGVCVTGSWECRGERVAVSGSPGDMLLSKRPLPLLFSPEEAESAQSVAPPTRDLFADLKQWGTRDWADEREEGEGEMTVFPHLHTLWVVGTSRYFEVQLLQRGLLFTFTRLVQEAVRQYGPSVVRETTLPAPLCGQCVVTNGQRLAVLWVQVGSLLVREDGGEGDDGGGRNVVAVERLGPLYEATEMLRGRKRRIVVGFNEDALRTLLATLLMH